MAGPTTGRVSTSPSAGLTGRRTVHAGRVPEPRVRAPAERILHRTDWPPASDRADRVRAAGSSVVPTSASAAGARRGSVPGVRGHRTWTPKPRPGPGDGRWGGGAGVRPASLPPNLSPDRRPRLQVAAGVASASAAGQRLVADACPVRPTAEPDAETVGRAVGGGPPAGGRTPEADLPKGKLRPRGRGAAGGRRTAGPRRPRCRPDPRGPARGDPAAARPAGAAPRPGPPHGGGVAKGKARRPD